MRILTFRGIHTLLLASKNRASATAKLTIPGAELMSAVTLARLITKVENPFGPGIGLLIEISSLSIHYLFGTSRVYTTVKITLKQNYIELYVS